MGKLLFFLLAVAILYYLFKNDKKNRVEEVAEGGGTAPEGEDMVLDPQCKTYVSKLEAFRVREGNKIHYFCSPECRDKYVARLKSKT